MSGIVPSQPIIEDPASHQAKSRKALIVLLIGILIVICGVVVFCLAPVGENASLSVQSIVALVIGALGGILIIWGLNLLPKVRMPPDDIIR